MDLQHLQRAISTQSTLRKAFVEEGDEFVHNLQVVGGLNREFQQAHRHPGPGFLDRLPVGG